MSIGGFFTGRGFFLSRFLIVFVIVVPLFIFYETLLPRIPRVQHDSPFVSSPGAKPGTVTKELATSSPESAPPTPLVPTSGFHPVKNETCKNLPGAEKVLVMLKTGATELYQKLPTHFVTTFKCIPNYMIFSDAEQMFGEVKVLDAIAPVSKKMQEEQGDFELYRQLAQWQKEGQDVSKLRGGSGWNLDKWKFLPMLHMAFESADPSIEWFVMMEADTSISWLNLLLWLKTIDPTQPYYLGAQNYIGDTLFGHGGSGLVISRKAADMLETARSNVGKESYDRAWEEQTKISCCGDEIVARAFKAVGVTLTGAWPIIQGETINTVDFTSNHWCTPPTTFHHATSIEVDAHWQFEQQWADEHGWNTPYCYRDLFAHFIEPYIAVNRTSWNNFSNDHKFVSPELATGDDKNFDSLEKYEQDAVASQEACAEACMRKGDDCIQWMWTTGRCYLGKDVRFGTSDAREAEHWTSGWIQERVIALKQRFVSCEVKWKTWD